MATVSLNGNGAVVAAGSTNVALTSLFKLPTAGKPAAAGSPAYLVVTAIDRNEYTVGATRATGSFSGNGKTLGFSSPPASVGDDGRYAGIVFALQASTGRYYNSTYGYLDALTYKSSASANDVTSISLFATNSPTTANAYASNVYAMAQANAGGYQASATVATQSSFAGPVPSQATPSSIAATAMSFVGKTWNSNGCWVLASTIAAEAGAALPVQSTMVGVPGQANGEWFVAFNGPAGQTGNWQNMVTAGQIIVIGNATWGHITTCVSGCGSTAMLVDNAVFGNGKGGILNSANDGSPNDIVIAAPHLASQEWANVLTRNVVIYQLDTPLVKVTATSTTLKSGSSLAGLFSATDPVGKSITQWQVYDTNAAGQLSGGSYHSAANALTVSNLSQVTLTGAAGSDTLQVRAFNGSYWGDWVGGTFTLSATATPKAPVLSSQTANQSWTAGQKVSLTLAANTFTDPDKQTLSYKATLGDGTALPSWLSFNATTNTFSGTAPTLTKQQTLSLKVTATDTDKLSVSETFSVTLTPAPAKAVVTLATQTANQSWLDGKSYSWTLPANTFKDSGGGSLAYIAFQVGGTVNATQFLSFNSATGTFSGRVPQTANGSAQIEVVAFNAAGSSAYEVFGINFSKTGAVAVNGLQSQVSGLVSAISAFGNGAQAAASVAVNKLPGVASTTATTATIASATGSMAQLLGQFDASGRATTATATQAVAMTGGQLATALTSLRKNDNGLLAVGR